jgi:hypothetical protein
MGNERGGRPEHQHMIVARAQHRVDGHDPVAAGTVLDHDRLPPALGEAVGQQPRAEIGAGAGTERHHEMHRPLRPGLRLRLRLRGRGTCGMERDAREQSGGDGCCVADLVAHGTSRDVAQTHRSKSIARRSPDELCNGTDGSRRRSCQEG